MDGATSLAFFCVFRYPVYSMNLNDIFNKVLGDPNEKELKRLWPVVKQVREWEKKPEIQSLTKADLPKKTEEFKLRVAGGETLDQILPEAFAVLLKACDLIDGESITMGKQTFAWHMRPFDVQILGGTILHRGNIAEMKTGEGKTLVCTLPAYLNALAGKGVHVVTVNDYLARRDATWMSLLYNALGLTVGVIVHGLNNEQRRAAYNCDITYATNNELGFDYLRDNMATSIKQQVQRGVSYAIVDEVDSILIDEARTPLIISQPAEESKAKYQQYATYVRQLQEKTHYVRDEKQKTATLTEEGVAAMEQILGVENIYTDKGFEEVHHIEQALRAHAMYQNDVDYVVKDGEIIIVDEFTGRLMPGRRYSHGLHQAIEAKEGVEVQRESKTLATITFQNLFRLYDKLAGMTGTAKTEEEEFESIYKLRTIVLPTNKPAVRADLPDAVYRTVAAKFMAVAKIAREKHEKGQPVLIGTTSIEKSEAMSALLTQQGIPHQVLNAKQHEKEAEIVSLAGQKGAVTIATNMAGRGTDIKLGEGISELGGLAILGTERHEARRIDNQLRGRAGRQGDPGESRFFVSMEDELMRLFGGDRLKSMMERLNVPDDVPLQNGMVSRAIEGAQKRVEGHHFDIRRHVLQYDNVMNKHREIIYKRRQKILEKLAAVEAGAQTEEGAQEALHRDVLDAISREVDGIVSLYVQGLDDEKWNHEELSASLSALAPRAAFLLTVEELKKIDNAERLHDHCKHIITTSYEEQCAEANPESVRQAERVVCLRSIDSNWMDHIDEMSHLREQVAFAGYAQRDPLIEYQDQGFRKFQQLIATIDATIVRSLLQIDFAQFAPQEVLQQAQQQLDGLQTNENQIESSLSNTGAGPEDLEGSPMLQNAARSNQRAGNNAQPIQSDKVGRNDPCPCGSGKKYKKCHGKED